MTDMDGARRLGGWAVAVGCLLAAGTPHAGVAQAAPVSPAITLHHAHLNSTDPAEAIAWYLRIWPEGRAGTVAGRPAFLAEMPLLFDEVEAPPPGAWDHRLQRSEPQSPFWHIGGFVNTTDRFEALEHLDGIGGRHAFGLVKGLDGHAVLLSFVF